jgi:hypothetical protein
MVKFCKSCRFYRGLSIGRWGTFKHDLCAHPRALDVVTARPMKCAIMRQAGASICDTEARLFETRFGGKRDASH